MMPFRTAVRALVFAAVLHALPCVASAELDYLSQWGAPGSANGQFSATTGIAVDGAGYIYVGDAGNSRIQVFDVTGAWRGAWGSSGSGNGQFSGNPGLDADSCGSVYVADQGNDRIQKFTSQGTFVTAWGAFGTGNGQFNGPRDVAVSRNGFVYVTDGDNDRVQYFTANGAYVGQWGTLGTGAGQFNLPRGIAVDRVGFVYVTDRNNHRVQKFTATGTFVTQWGMIGNANGQFNVPTGIAVSAAGRVLVAEASNHRVQVFENDGTFVCALSALAGAVPVSGSGNGEFSSPFDVEPDAFGNVYVADTNNNRVQRLGHLLALPLSCQSWLHDAFPANETPGLPGTANFDTTTAHIKTGFNISQTTGNLFRYDIPGDSLIAFAPGCSLRLDMVFRVLPGVGNYTTVGNPGSGLNAPFWNSYKANPGPFSGLGASINPALALAAHLASPSGWCPIVWNSARMDTAELNLFPVEALGNMPRLGLGKWAGTYHEAELSGARATLGIARNRCFLIDPSMATLDQSNVNCGTNGPYPPAWVNAAAGWNGTTTTTEHTKIIPDGLLTPGAHVQYFIRIQDIANPTSQFRMVPDTNRVSPQYAENSTDGHRWQQFGILPDRWQDPAFARPKGCPGIGMACMLYVDQADGRGNERVWASAADSISSTVPCDRGAHNGWTAPYDVDINQPAYYVGNKNWQPGTFWDMYGVRGTDDPVNGYAGSIGSRLSYRGGGTLLTGKWAMIAPTPEMLEAYYKVTFFLTADIDTAILGPFNDRSQDEVTFLQNWLSNGNTVAADRGIMFQGDSFVEDQFKRGGAQQAFVENFLGTSYVSPDLRTFAGLSGSCVSLFHQVVTLGSFGKNAISVDPGWNSDVLSVYAPVTTAQLASSYRLPAQGFDAGIAKTHSATLPWISLTNGWDLARHFNGFGTACSNSRGRKNYLYYMFNNLFIPICALTGSPGLTLDTPQATGREFINAIHIFGNPMRTGRSAIAFKTATAGHVQIRVYDVAGRAVRILADRLFTPGDHEIVWDGRNDAGVRLSAGVYFTRIESREGAFDAMKKITVLR